MSILVIELVERSPAEEAIALEQFKGENLRNSLLKIYKDASLDYSDASVEFGRYSEDQLEYQKIGLEEGGDLVVVWVIITLPHLTEDNLVYRMGLDNSFIFETAGVEI